MTTTAKKCAHHARLMDRMATRNGADFDLARQTGYLTGSELNEALASCVGCSDAADCEARLDRGEPGVPDYCRNAALFSRVETVTN